MFLVSPLNSHHGTSIHGAGNHGLSNRRCPYCLRDKPEKPISDRHFCTKEIGDERIVLIDEKGKSSASVP